MPFLSRPSISKLEPEIRALAIDLIERFRAAPSVDFAASFSLPFPSMTALHFLGFPGKDAARLDHLINTAINGRGNDASRDAGAELNAYIEAFLSEHRARPHDPANIVSTIAHASISGQQLGESDQLSVTKLLLFGGFTTTTFALNSAMHWLAENPADLARLRAEPALIEAAVEEFVRFASPGTYLGRTVVAETELAETRLSPGERVLVSYGAANRDPEIFDRPNEVILDRNPTQHMGFGYGTHACMGLHLARLELRVAFEELLSRLPDFVIDEAAPILWASGETQGMTTLPLLLKPSSRTAQ